MEIPRLTRGQQQNCLRVQREFIQELIDTEDLGPRLEIKFFDDAFNPTVKYDYAEELLTSDHILLKLAFKALGNLLAYGVSFNNGVTTWAEIENSLDNWQDSDYSDIETEFDHLRWHNTSGIEDTSEEYPKDDESSCATLPSANS